MDFEEFSSKISTFVKKYWLPLALSILGLLFILYGLISLVSNKPQKSLEFSHTASSESVATKSASLIAVDIEGAVVAPGVYKLNIGSIVEDVITLSKGLAKDADKDYVAKNINLAAKLTDSEKIYIPKVGEETSERVQGLTSTSSVNNNSLININSATSSELDSLPGIGPVTAGKIINGRPFTSIDDLLSKRIVSQKVFDGLKDKITAF